MKPDELSRFAYFSQLDRRQLEIIAALVGELSFDRGHVLFNEGEPPKGLYMLVRGSIKVSRISPEGREQILIVIGPGQTFNDVPVFDGGPCPATTTALERSLVGLISMEDMKRLVRTYPTVAEGMLRVFSSRLRGLTSLVADLTHLDVLGRLAKILLSYQSASGQSSYRVGQQELASMVGTTREVVSRGLRTLEEQGAIARRSGTVEIVSPERLDALLGESMR